MDINLKNISSFEPNKVKGYLEGILFKKWGGMVRVGFVENHNGGTLLYLLCGYKTSYRVNMNADLLS